MSQSAFTPTSGQGPTSPVVAGSNNILSIQEWLHLVHRLQEPDQIFKLLYRLWVFEEDILMTCLTQPPMPVDHQLTIVSDQLCAILPAWRSLMASFPPAPIIQNYYQALTIQLNLPWQQFQFPPIQDNMEGRARFLLFTLKMMHLQNVIRSLPHYETLAQMQQSMPQNVPYMRQVRILARLQQICIQTATQPEILFMWRQGILVKASNPEKEYFLRQCLLDVPADEQDLFPFLVAVLQLPHDHILALQSALSHSQDYQLQLLTLLLRKPGDVVADIYDFLSDFQAPDVSSNPSSSVATPPTCPSPSTIHTPSRTIPVIPRPPPAPVNAILTIVRQPPKETIKDKILNPLPGIRVDGLRDDEPDTFVVKVTLVKTSDQSLVEDGLQGCTVHQVSASRLVNFKKLKIKHTCKQLNCHQVSLRFQLMRQTENGSFDPTGVEIFGIPMEVFSHTSQLHGNVREEGAPVISGILPDHGPVTGGGTVALLGCDLLPGPDFVVSFGGILIKPRHAEVGWALFEVPPYKPHIGSPVYITVSMDGGTTLCDSGCSYSYENV
eukprot:TRINITY_DN20284_c0_g1_i1.p1 TRINITY_DN20284_c0_g1~~TRINITY_DN20284_c0_g1_i1.p1  ORF type:complete len:552 (+),score=82.93 TRINITY_DN20284_c0_g1_i1:73-1728(+)